MATKRPKSIGSVWKCNQFRRYQWKNKIWNLKSIKATVFDLSRYIHQFQQIRPKFLSFMATKRPKMLGMVWKSNQFRRYPRKTTISILKSIKATVFDLSRYNYQFEQIRPKFTTFLATKRPKKLGLVWKSNQFRRYPRKSKTSSLKSIKGTVCDLSRYNYKL